MLYHLNLKMLFKKIYGWQLSPWAGTHDYQPQRNEKDWPCQWWPGSRADELTLLTGCQPEDHFTKRWTFPCKLRNPTMWPKPSTAKSNSVVTEEKVRYQETTSCSSSILVIILYKQAYTRNRYIHSNVCMSIAEYYVPVKGGLLRERDNRREYITSGSLCIQFEGNCYSFSDLRFVSVFQEEPKICIRSY